MNNEKQSFIWKPYEAENIEFLNCFVNDTKEAYCLGKRYDDKIFCYPITMVNFDNNISADNHLTLTGSFEMMGICNNAVLESCSTLLTEYKQIMEYEEKIEKLEKDLEHSKKLNKKLKSEILHQKQNFTSIQQMRDTLDAVKQNMWFAIFIDDYSTNGKESIIQVPLATNNKFFESDYWAELFEPNILYSKTEFYDVVNRTHDGMGYNAFFTICSSKYLNEAYHHVLFYGNEEFEVIMADEEFMYMELNDIWKIVKGYEHK